ncbi:MAG: branched-chain amino acid ABC transporter permease [Clostridiales bacterium]|nr:branched-chain amino acid ABC transporter permease [Clostridiales bacterium]OPZ69761.1 MAG: High-affinity branched-chain amino acid transport system permease protein LivH [Firmicutes bacterium ADurb.Bin467]
MQLFFQYLVSGIALGSLYALVAIGYSLVYGVLELINMTHGTIYMIGAFMFYIAYSLWGASIAVAALFAIAVSAILGSLIEYLTLRPLRKARMAKTTALICTIGVSTILQNLMLFLMGSQSRSYPSLFFGKYLVVNGVYITYLQITIVAVAAVLLVVLNLFIKRSKMGMAMRATSASYDAAELMGISTNFVIGMTFFVGAALAAVSGIFGCMTFMSVNISSGVSVGMKTFAATVLGGIGEFKGAVLGGLIIGIVESMTAGYVTSEVRDIAAFSVLILVLIVRPSGLLGKPAQKKV